MPFQKFILTDLLKLWHNPSRGYFEGESITVFIKFIQLFCKLKVEKNAFSSFSTETLKYVVFRFEGN